MRELKHRLVFQSLAAITLMLCVAMPAKAAAVNETFAISGQITNTCNGETVNFSGTIHLVGNTTVNGNSVHFVSNDDIHVTGTDPSSGASYVGNESDQAVNNFTLTGSQSTFTLHSSFSLTGLGATPNLKSLSHLQVTVNANGNVTVDNFSLTSTCQ